MNCSAKTGVKIHLSLQRSIMMNIQANSETQDNVSHYRPMPLMSLSLAVPPPAHSRTVSSSCRTSMSEPTCLSPTPPVSIIDDNLSTTSTLVDRMDISKFHFVHVIKVPHGTNLLASDNQSTTLCINSMGNILHLITPTGYHIRSSRWPESEKKIVDLLWCEGLQVYLAATSNSLYALKYDSNQSLLVEKCLDFHPSAMIFIACNSYRLYIHNPSTKSIDVYTLQFAHLRSKQLPDAILNHQIEGFSCSDSFLVLHFEQITSKIVLLDPISMAIEYEYDLSYTNITSLRCFDNENTLVFIGVKDDGGNRLIFFNFGNENEASEMQQTFVEKAIERNEQFLSLLPNGRDLMILNVDVARVQYLKYRS